MTMAMIADTGDEYQPAIVCEPGPWWADTEEEVTTMRREAEMEFARQALGSAADWQALWARLAGNADPGRFAVLVLLGIEHGAPVGQAAYTAQALIDGGYDLGQARAALTRARGVVS